MLIWLLGAAAAFIAAIRTRRQWLLLVGLALVVLGATTPPAGVTPAQSQWSTRQVRDACEAAVMREATSDRLGSNYFEPTWYPASDVWQWEVIAETRGATRWVETIWMCEVAEESGAVYLTVKP